MQSQLFGGASESSTLLGDSHLFAAYEVLTESFYTSWRPRLFLSLTHTLPTGKALEEAQKDGLSDVSGIGRHQTQLGVHLFKRTKLVLLSAKGELYYRYKRSLKSDLELGASQGGSLEFGVIRNPPKSPFSYGLFWRALQHGKKEVVTSERRYETSQERVFEVAPYVGLALDGDWALDLVYTDQTLLGPVKNTTLSRTFALTLNKYIPL